jgi:hypothetical protein
MIGLHDGAYFLGGVFLANAVPHYVTGVMGRSFQSPFAKPPGKGLSSSTVNVLWGFGNLALAYCLILHVGQFDVRAADHIASLGLGFLLMGVMAARTFGPFHAEILPLALEGCSPRIASRQLHRRGVRSRLKLRSTDTVCRTVKIAPCCSQEK